MRILVCGGRDYDNYEKVRDVVVPLCPENEDNTIIAGGARGADHLAAMVADVFCLGYKEFKADWRLHGKKAGILRNIQMLEEGKPDLVVAFPGGKGTAHMVKIAKEAGIKVIEVKNEE